MNGIVININPVLFNVGGFSLNWYGLIVAGAVIAAIFVATKEGRRRGIAPTDIHAVAFWSVVAGFLGARLFHVVERLDYHLANPLTILAFWQGGLAIWGGVVTGVLVGAFYAKSRKLPIARLADVAVLALLVGQIIGRIACIINGDAYSGPTDLPWGFIYIHPNAMVPDYLRGIPVHPYPVYEMMWNLATLALLWTLGTRLRTEGLLFFGYVFLYSVGRFFISFVRREQIWFWGLQEAQLVALLGLVIAVVAIIYLLKRAASTHKAELLGS